MDSDQPRSYVHWVGSCIVREISREQARASRPTVDSLPRSLPRASTRGVQSAHPLTTELRAFDRCTSSTLASRRAMQRERWRWPATPLAGPSPCGPGA